ncbi:thiopurine S-methyltransferase [Pseudomonas sp. NPDC089734]|uniref:thiopurine S-methyltransferase n=1 Tax=Pseudomonas sp. NPDC089734 TaxID=3364469 RepID=UPI0038262E43
MQPEFWHHRWSEGQIGFNQEQVNPYLQNFWPELQLPQGARVLVPLCGKSLDMDWLVEKGFSVVGVELSEKAAQAYFEERSRVPEILERDGFKVYRHGACQIWCGDFFAVTAAHIGHCDAFYDRAALIALPDDMRGRYAEHLGRLLPPGSRGLLISLDYDQAQLDGPPFSVSESQLGGLLSDLWQVTKVGDYDALPGSHKARKSGVTRMDEQVYRLLRV